MMRSCIRQIGLLVIILAKENQGVVVSDPHVSHAPHKGVAFPSVLVANETFSKVQMKIVFVPLVFPATKANWLQADHVLG